MASNKPHDRYPAHVWANWSTKALGPKPSADELTTAHAFCQRPGKQSLGIAMALRSTGITRPQMYDSSRLFDGNGTYAMNKLGAQFKGHNPPFDGSQVDGAIKLKLNANGRAFMARNAQAAAGKVTDTVKAKPATPTAPKAKKPASKPRKPVQAPPVAAEAPQADGNGVTAQN